MGGIAAPARGEDVEVARAEDERIEGLREQGDACAVLVRQCWRRGRAGQGRHAPSELLLAWMAHIRISFDDVCETSPRMWKRLNRIAQRRGGRTA